MFPATLETGISKPTFVKMGCDLRGLKVREVEGDVLFLDFKIES